MSKAPAKTAAPKRVAPKTKTPKPAAPRTPTMRTAYLVLGMHRSGTSAVTQLLALAGARLPANVMPGDEHNAKGYFEPWKIAQFDDARLRAAGSAWDDPFAFPFRPLADAEEQDWLDRGVALLDEEYGKADWLLMKDPRATVLLPFWRRLLAARNVQARCVIPVRHPLAVAGSLLRRDGFPPEKSVLVWASYMLAAEAYTRDLPRAFVGYDALLADWRAEVARIEAAHGAPLPKLTDAAAKKIDTFLTPDLRHNAANDGLAKLGWAGAIAEAVHGWFAERAAGGDPDIAILERAAADLAARQADMGPLFASVARDLAVARADRDEARDRMMAAEHLAAEQRDTHARDRETLEAGWRAGLARQQSEMERLYLRERVAQEAETLLGDVEAALDAALADEV